MLEKHLTVDFFNVLGVGIVVGLCMCMAIHKYKQHRRRADAKAYEREAMLKYHQSE